MMSLGGKACVVAALLGSGCASPSTDGAEPSEEVVGRQSQAATQIPCSGSVSAFSSWASLAPQTTTTVTASRLVASKVDANIYFRYLLGGPAPSAALMAIPTTGAQGDYSKRFQTGMCGLRAASTASATARVDPSPARLNSGQALTATNGSSAVAAYTDGSGAARAFKFPAPGTSGSYSCSYNGYTALGGERCTTASLSSTTTDILGVVVHPVDGVTGAPQPSQCRCAL